jgi:hypothetical protein
MCQRNAGAGIFAASRLRNRRLATYMDLLLSEQVSFCFVP